ncbi:hypothetical protein [Helicobacter sp. T3_23-1059]
MTRKRAENFALSSQYKKSKVAKGQNIVIILALFEIQNLPLCVAI